MARAGLRMPRSEIATSVEQAEGVLAELGLPCVVRPAFTLGAAEAASRARPRSSGASSAGP